MTSNNAIEITSEQAFDILHLPENQTQFFSGTYAKLDGTIRTFNGRRKVTKHLTKKLGGNKKLASHISLSYNDYRGGEDIKKNINNLIKYAQKMTGKKLEATTTSAVPAYQTPLAFRKSIYP